MLLSKAMLNPNTIFHIFAEAVTVTATHQVPIAAPIATAIQALSKHHHIIRPQNRINHQTAKIQRVTLIMQRIIQTRKTFMTTIMMTFLIIMTQKTTITDINS